MKTRIKNTYPLTPVQEGLLFRDIYNESDREKDEYLIQGILEIEGDLDIKLLKKSWQEITNKHDIMRTGFIWQDLNRSLQYVLEEVEVPFKEYDWVGVKKDDLENKINKFIKEDRYDKFDLSRAPVFRVSIIKCANNMYCMIWSSHHILLDGWSSTVILSEIFSVYNNLVNGIGVRLKDRKEYVDYIQWLNRQDKNCAMNYWKNYLEGVEGATELSFRKSIENDIEIEEHGDYSFKIGEELSEKVRKYVSRNNLTVNTVIQGAIGVVLSKYTGSNDLIYGITISGRSINLEGVEDIIGLFINTLPLRVKLGSHETIKNYLKRLQEDTHGINENGHVSLAEVQKLVQREGGRLFDTILVFENYPIDKSHHDTIDKFRVFNGRGIEKTEYPLTIVVVADSEIYIKLSYQSSNYSNDIIKKIAVQIGLVIECFINNAIVKLKDIDILTEEEKHRQLVEWNDTKEEYARDKLIHELFEEQVIRNPDRIALVYEREQITYRELNERSNQLGYYLRKKGVGPDILVGISLERSIEMVVGILGILKAGGGYVPLDPSYPEERLRYMIEDSGIRMLLTQEGMGERFSYYTGEIVEVENTVIVNTESRNNLIRITDSENIAYVIYTSGSTGKPKGVVIQSRSVSNYLKYCINRYLINDNLSCLLHSSISFDMSVTTLFVPLITGTCVELLKEDKTSELLLDQIINNKNCIYNLIKLTPSHLKLIRYESKLLNKMNLTLVIGGEGLLVNDIKSLLDQNSNINLYNEYGPTEATVGACTYRLIEHKSIGPNTTIPIGRPIWNSSIYILDRNLSLVPVGVVGEIYIGGVGLARGYLNRPELTAEKFIANPFVIEEDVTSNRNLRIYRSGDLGRYLEDGNIEYVGRIDDQVKIRGYRIELGEIESVIGSHELVEQVVVIAKEDEINNKRLVGYIVAVKEESKKLEVVGEYNNCKVLGGELVGNYIDRIRTYVTKELPEYMVPSYFMIVDRIPLTVNGKIDRKSLPEVDSSIRGIAQEYTEPRNDLEKELCDIWSEVLRIEKIGIHDNFFRIGGHSLLATQVISRIRSKYNITVSLRALFENSTIEKLSTVVQDVIRIKELGEDGHKTSYSQVPVLLKIEDREGKIPLSYAQQRLWFLDELMPGLSIYNIPIAMKLKGILDIEILQRVFNKIIERHEVLRTVFKKESNGIAYQQVLNHIDAIEVIDIEKENNKTKIIERYKENEANRKFDLEKGPLISIKIIKVGDNEHILLMTMHHIISDGWSMEIFNKEVNNLYRSYIKGEEYRLKDLRVQYIDYSIWQRRWLVGEVLEKQLQYWQEKLRDIPDVINLVTDRVRPKELSYKGGRYNYKLDKKLSDDIREKNSKTGVSLYMMLLSILNLLLHKLSGDEDIVVGSPIANRHYKETEELIGFFVNTIVMRCNIKGDKKFREILEEVRIDTLESYNYQDIPFEQLVDHLEVERVLNRNPVFQIMFTVQNLNLNDKNNTIKLEKVEVEYMQSSYAVSKFDLEIRVYEPGNGEIGISIGYLKELYDEDTIKSFANCYSKIIEEVIGNEEIRVRDIDILTEEEKHRQLVEWNDTKEEYARDKLIHELFEEQVIRNPDRIALVYEREQITYRELNERSNQLGYYLRKKGVGPDILVGISLERSIEMVVGILGILKAGGGYVPLDPSYPEERLRYMIEDSGIRMLLTQEGMGERFSYYTGEIVEVENTVIVNTESRNNLIRITDSENIILAIYTSGSTAKPKGVLIKHQNLNNRINWLSNINYKEFKFRKKCSISNYGFVDFCWEIFVGFNTSLTCVMLNIFNIIDLTHLLTNIKKHNITDISLTPSFLENILNISDNNQLINTIISMQVSGEYLKKDLIKKFFFKNGNLDLLNRYGSTEALSGFITIYNDSTTYTKNICNNTNIYILDRNLSLVPVGVVGEIYIGGVGLARGYLNRPELTAEKFIANPFVIEEDVTSNRNLRIYRSGDLGRYLEDGNIEYVGRIDDQVKIRGYRIELGEIESVIGSHELVEQVVVIAKEDEINNKRLVGYIVAVKEESKKLEVVGEYNNCKVLGGELVGNYIDRIRTYVTKELPEYMVPSYFMIVDRIPLTVNGKIDRKSLPEVDSSIRGIAQEYTEPRNDLEKELCDIWSEVLRIEKIGIHDNFFRIGGHSLLATQVISRIRSKYNITVSLRALFENSTIEKLSTVVQDVIRIKELGEDGHKTSYSQVPVLLKIEDREGKIPLSYAQQRLWFLDELMPGLSIYNIPIAMKLKGILDIEILQRVFNKIIERHEVLRTVFKKESNGIAYQQVLNHIDAIEVIDIEKENNKTKIIERYKENEANRKFDLEKGPLISIKIIKVGDNEHILLMTMHHIISDGWSMEIFNKEVNNLYRSYIKGEEYRLKDLRVQYIDYSIWQRRWLVGEVLEKQLQYWQEKLRDIPDVINLVTDRVRPKELSYKGGRYNYKLDKKLSDDIREKNSKTGVSLYMMLLSILNLLLHKLSGDEDIVVGSPIANRHYKETEELIGFFVNTIVMRCNIKGDKKFREILEEVRIDTLESYNYQDIPFEQLVDHLEVERVLNRNPVFQIMFTVQNLNLNDKNNTIKLEKVEVEYMQSSYAVSKFDLEIRVYEPGNGEIGISIGYLKELYDEDTIKSFANCYSKIIEEVIGNEEIRVRDIDILTEEEKHRQLVEWNDTKEEYARDKLIHELFEEQVIRNPDRIALVYEREQITYRELNERSNQLGYYLRKKGVGPDILVGISLERSIEMVVGILGILKAGGGYVPLDPSYPEERLRYMIEDSGIRMLLTQEGMGERFSYYTGEIVEVENTVIVNTESRNNLIRITDSENIAYVIYTSGSTGKPKGVVINYSGIVNRFRWTLCNYSITNSDVFLQVASIGFDISYWEILYPLIGNAKLVCSGSDKYNDPKYLLTIMDNAKVSIAHFVPSMLDLLINILDNNKNNTIKKVICGGEKVSLDMRKRFYNSFKSSLLYCSYGPTEVSISVTNLDCDNRNTSNSYSIGRPIWNSSIYILDRNLSLVPVGVVGEIYIGGVGLARGYLNRPELTAEKFIANPFVIEEDVTSNRNLRIYRSGDLGRYLEDGNIEYVGRIDDQVKIRGYRIELGEIESVIGSHELVEQVVVIAKEDEINNKRLVGYIVAVKEESKKLEVVGEYNNCKVLGGELVGNYIDRIRTYVTKELPEYMVPSYFMIVDRIPLTVNGKIDRKSLPEVDSSIRGIAQEYTEPRNDLEKELCDIWSEVLRIEKIGIHDNFFRIGGDSIISIQLVSRARKRGIDFSVRDVFNNPTISKLSNVTVSRSCNESNYKIAEQGKVLGRIELTPIQRYFFNEENIVNKNHYNQAVLLGSEEVISENIIKALIEGIIDHHDILRSVYSKLEEINVNNNVRWKQECLDKGSYVYKYRDLSHISDEELSKVINDIATEVQESFDIESNRLIGVVIYKCGNGRGYRLLLAIHHLVVDGVSWRILLEDIELGYKQLLSQEGLKLPIKTHSYKDWSEALLKYANDERLSKEIEYWRETESKGEDIRWDKLEGEEKGIRGNKFNDVYIELEADDTNKLLRRIHKAYNTEINDILLTGLGLALQECFGEKDLLIDLEGHGREEIIEGIDISRTVGWFTSIYPFYLGFNKESKDIGDNIKEIKERLRKVPNKGVGYGILKYIRENSKLGNKSANILFNYLGQWDIGLERANIRHGNKSKAIFSYALEGSGRSVSQENGFSYLVSINSLVRNNKLKVSFRYSKEHYESGAMDELSRSYVSYLKKIIEHCSKEGVYGYTPSDFKFVDIDNLENLIKEIE